MKLFSWFFDMFSNITHDQVVVGANVFLVIFTIVLAYMAYKQFQDSRIINRAYLSVRPNGVKTFVTDPSKLVGYISIQNVGRLIAKEVTCAVSIEWNDLEGLKKFPAPEPLEIKTVVFPKAALVIGTKAIDIERTGGTAKPSGFLYIWGVVKYKDGFWRNRKTEFCHYYFCGHREVPTSDDATFRISASNGRDSGHGNNAD
ncbi:MAG TPA: hypothetical protein VGF53_06820 [Pseudolabrys sp.]|jgi:hypothetical protein